MDSLFKGTSSTPESIVSGRIEAMFNDEFAKHCCDSRCSAQQIAQLRFAFMSGAALLMRELFQLQSNVIVSTADIDKVKDIAAELARFSKNVYQSSRVFNL